MNTKKLLSMLLVSLGAFTLGLTGCNNHGNPSTEPSESEPAPTPDSTPESTPDETVTPSETAPSETAPSETVTPDSTPSESTPEIVYPESTEYEVTFNYDSWQEGVTVWTDYAIDQTIAPDPAGISELDLEGRHTVPITDGGLDTGTYYFAIDANGYIVYASYGLGLGYGGPGDGYYHNQDAKDPGMADNWALHEEWAAWPSKTEDGRNAWTLYDFLIPTDGFVIKGYAKDPEFVSIWKLLTGQNQAPVAENNTLEYNTAPKAFNKWYFSINEDHKLEVRERLAEELVDENGDQEFETLSKNFEATEADNPIVYNTLEGVGELADDSTIQNTKVIVVWARGTNAIVQDVQGNSILVYDPSMAEVAVGDTLVLGSAVKVTYNGYPELKTLADVTTLPAYGKLPVVAPTEVTAENVAELWVEANNYGFYKLVKAEVIGEKQVKLGDTTIDLYSTTFPENVKVGDFVDITLTMQCYKGAVQGKGNTDDISRYYNISFDVDGVAETEQVVHAAAMGTELTVTAKNDDPNYSFSHWAKVVVVEEEETLEKVSDTAELKVTVGESDEEYVAVYDYAAWALLPETYVETFNAEVKAEVDCGADALSVLTSGTLHADGAWNGGAVNSSWRFIVIVDADGKVCYAVNNPANGYGGPNGNGYYAHPDYADYTTNPAFNILEGYGPWVQGGTAHNLFELKVPEGGFIVLGHGTGTQSLLGAIKSATLEDTTADAQVNSRTSIDDTTRLFYDAGKGKLLAFVDENNEEALVNGILGGGAENHPAVFTSAHENVSLGDFTVAFDAAGKVTFASYTASGYGGPADGFYHDGAYAVTPGSHCGIFDLHEKFAGWPNKAEIDGEEVNAWSLYTVKAPEGWTIVTGNSTQMVDLLNAVTNNEYSADSWDSMKNTLFEGMVDGSLTDMVTITATNGNKVSALTVADNYPEEVVKPLATLLTSTTEAPALEDYTVAIDATGKIVFAGYTAPGYGGPGDLGNVYTDGTLTAVAGQAVAFYSLDAEWAPWPAVTAGGQNAWGLFSIVVPEGMTVITGDSAEMLDLVNALLGTTHEVLPTGDLFKEVEDASLTQTIKVDEDGYAFVSHAQVGTSMASTGVAADFVWNEKTGLWEAELVGAGWAAVYFSYTDAEGNAVTLKYENTTFTGSIQSDPTVFGCYVEGSPALFIEEGWPAEGKFMFTDGGAKVLVQYNPETNTLTVTRV